MKILRPLALASLLALTVFLFVELARRADSAYDAKTPIRNDIRATTVLFDRAEGTGTAREGWGNQIPGQGVWSITPAPVLVLPTSTARGDVELTLVMASGAPGVRARPVIIKAGDTPVGLRQIGTWTPKGDTDETVLVIAPEALRPIPYQLRITFDLAQPDGQPQAIRVASAKARVLRLP